MSKVVGITLRLFSILFKLMGVGCLVFAYVVVSKIIESRTSAWGYDFYDYPELYLLTLTVAFLVPVSGAIVAFIASFFLDIWVLIRIQTKMIREINSYGRTETKHFL